MLAIGAQGRLAAGGAKADAGHIPHQYVGLDFQRLKGRRGSDAGGGAHVDRLPIARQITGRRVKGNTGKCTLHIAQRQTTAGQLQLVDINAKDRLTVPVNLQVGHAFNRNQTVLHTVLHYGSQLLRRSARGGDGNPHYRLCICICLHNLGLVCIFGQLVDDPRNSIAHICGSHIDVDVVIEFYRHAAASEPRI